MWRDIRRETNPNNEFGGRIRRNESYRSDVQGLRAIAVLAVVAFHAGLIVPAGFVGVDVFFVISGFVITTVLYRESALTGGVRWNRFFLKRIKRLGPALALMLTVVLLLSLFFLSPLGLQQNTALTAIGATLISANAVILAISGGYFDQPAETNPLLNTWSLSVEEQFYLVFPLVWLLALVLSKRIALRTRLILLTSTLSAGSFGLMLLWSEGLSFPGADTLLGFYGTISRAWEFGLGAVIALLPKGLFSRLGNLFLQLLAAGGLLCVVLSALFLDPGGTWPSWWTLAPTLGTAMVIAAGSGKQTLVGRLVGSRPLELVGDFSYSIYLWHWPLIVFAKLLWPTSLHAPLAAAIVSLVPAILSFYFLEQPLRRKELGGPRMVAILVVTITAIPLATSWLVKTAADHFLAPRLTSGEVTAFFAGDLGGDEYKATLENFFPCAEEFMEIIAVDPRLTCHQSVRNSPVEIAVLGDSHAKRLFLGVAENTPDRNVAYYSHGGLQPSRDASPTMGAIIDYVVENQDIETVIVSAWWNFYELDPNGLRTTVDALSASGKQVFVIDGVPDFTFDAYRCKYGVGGLIRINPVCQELPDRNDQLREIYLPVLEGITSESNRIFLVNIYDYFCDDFACSMVADEQLMFQDNNHLNKSGSVFAISNAARDNRFFGQALIRSSNSQ